MKLIKTRNRKLTNGREGLKTLSVILLMIFCGQPIFLWGQDSKPKIGLALSGGGAKGIAQIGCLKVLEREGIRPDFITGTSIGSILGGLYAIGYSVEDLERLAQELDWENYFNDDLDRIHYPIEERFATDRYQIRFPLENGKIALPTGFVKGQKISLLLSRLTIPAHGIKNFDNFEIPYRAIATNFETGQAVVYKSGDLADAMRASMSIPSVFEPCSLNGKLLIDGGVARNLPVEDALAMGAELVIAIDIGAPLYKKEELNSILNILDQTSSFRVVESNIQQAALADIVIRPAIDDISALTFDQNDTLMARGEKAALEQMADIKNATAPQDTTVAKRGVTLPQKVKIVAFQVTGCDEKQVKVVQNLLQIRTPKTYELDEIENRIKKLYGSGLVKMASYRLLPEQDGYRLIVGATTQKGEFIQVSANYDSRLKAGFLFNLTLRNRIFSGSKLSLDLKISENPSVILDYLAYTSRRPNLGWQLRSAVHIYPGLSYINDKKEDQFRMRHFSAEANIFSGINNQLLILTGLGIESYGKTEEFFDPDSDDLRLRQYYFQLKFLRDNYDRLHFPKDGSRLLFEGKYTFNRELILVESDSSSAIHSNNALLRLQAGKVFPMSKRIKPVVSIDAGYIRRVENNFLNRFYLGRGIPNEITHVEFMGLRYMEKPTSAYAIGSFKLRTEPFQNIFASPVFNYAYAELKSMQLNETGMPSEVITKKESIFGGGIELGWLTVLGPAILTSEYNFKEKRMNFFFHLGYIF